MRSTTHAHLKDDPSVILWDKRPPPMDDLRAYTLASELGVSNEVLGGKAKDLGIRYRNYMTPIPPKDAATLRKAFAPKKDGPPVVGLGLPTELHDQLLGLFGPFKLREGDALGTWVLFDREEDPSIGGRIRKRFNPVTGDTYRVHVAVDIPCPWGTEKQAANLNLKWSENQGFEGSVRETTRVVPSPLKLHHCTRCGNKTRITDFTMCTACFRSQSMP